jgi:nicotinate-nucleotide adenylyltransferase
LAKRIGILGGTFNPIHNGHLAAAEEVRLRLNLDQILFIPSSLPPHKLDEVVPPAAERMEMVRLAIAGNAHFAASDIELQRGGKSYTIDTIKALRGSWPEAELYFITGLDSFLDIQVWHRWQDLLGLCHFVVIARPGYHFRDLAKLDFLKNAEGELLKIDQGALSSAKVSLGAYSVYLESIPLHDISSTDIRNAVKVGKNIKYFLPEAVLTYIIEMRIYA